MTLCGSIANVLDKFSNKYRCPLSMTLSYITIVFQRTYPGGKNSVMITVFSNFITVDKVQPISNSWTKEKSPRRGFLTTIWHPIFYFSSVSVVIAPDAKNVATSLYFTEVVINWWLTMTLLLLLGPINIQVKNTSYHKKCLY